MASKQSKADLRKQIKTTLKTLSEDQITTQSHRAQQQILSLPQYRSATRLSIYLSMPAAEAQTSQLVRHALGNDKQVFVPYIHRPEGAKRKVIDMLRLHSLDDYEGLERDSWGIPSLPADSVEGRENAMGGKGLGDGDVMEASGDGEGRKGGGEGTLDFVVVPGVGFDEGCNRLGHGGGFYDGWLSRWCSDGTRKPYLEQMLPSGQEIPITDNDWIVDAVAVGDGRLLTLDD
ncbi:uncharacterized protein LTR77_010785 [Saxophila tyrrhenica]|uniref:5-formyltetrahydrofolate cyclo-ligase n=1 Tax=Saxophila tyrrhenica TaxID=1690608 RepID=A0AAV9NU42_9PEZI|nr:hypothetical protein LTR77_010785 [Saxophila tyrrhenica]